MDERIALVLGAGASQAMGYPLGAELCRDIISKATGEYRDLVCSPCSGIELDELEDFVEVFESSQMPSIDVFLARRPSYATIGKLVIAASLLTKEKKELLKICDHRDHWYRYFFQKRIAIHDWEHLDLSCISVVTFNYDRSFEHYLLYAMANAYGRNLKEVNTKINQMEIIHIYGVLGSCNPSEKNYVSYGLDPLPASVKNAALGLRVIPEGRDDDETLLRARAVLSAAEKIAFLGFGFDDINLQRLNSRVTCSSSATGKGDRVFKTKRTVVATCFGMTDAEALKAARATTANGYDVLQLNTDFRFCMCLELLRETLILD